MKITHLFRYAGLHRGLAVSGLLTVLALCPLTASSQQQQPQQQQQQQRSRVVVRTRQSTPAQSTVPINTTQNQRTQQQPTMSAVITGDFDFSRFERKYYNEIPDPPGKEDMSSDEYLRYMKEQTAQLKKRTQQPQRVQTLSSGNVSRNRNTADNGNYATPTNRRVNGSNKTSFSSPRPEILSIERKVFELVNAQRRLYGIRSVTWSDALEQAARQHSENMGINHFFDHIDLDGNSVRDRVNRFDLEWTGLGENLALNYGGKNPVEQAVEQWMNSSAHRENMLKGTWTQSAVGVYVTGEGQYYFTQIFIKN